MMNPTESVAWSGTGHRVATRRNPDGLTEPQLAWVRDEVRIGLHRLNQQGPIVIHSGMACGFDLALSAVAFELQIPFVAHIPYESQPMLWPPGTQAEWIRLRSVAADEVKYQRDRNPATPEERNALLHARNDGLLKAADRIIACWDARKRKGGTFSAVGKAQKLGLAGIHLDPATRVVRRVESGGWL